MEPRTKLTDGRKRLGMTQGQVARMAGLSRATVARAECGQRIRPPLLLAICRTLRGVARSQTDIAAYHESALCPGDFPAAKESA